MRDGLIPDIYVQSSIYWEKYKEEEKNKMFVFHDWEENRKKEYYDIVQPMLFKYLPDLNKTEGDYWVIYAVCIRDNYEEWKSLCEEMETTIDYKMPLESVNWKYEDWHKLFKKHFPKYKKTAEVKRDKRISGQYL